MKTELFPYTVGGKQETANVSEMQVCHLHFICEISHNYLQSPVFTIQMVLVSKSCKQLQYILKYYTCLSTTVTSMKQSNFVTVTQLATNRYFKSSQTYQHPSGVQDRKCLELRQLDLLDILELM